MPTDALPPEIQRELDAIDAALAGRPVDPELTEIGALAIALREERPEPPPAFASSMDRKVADGFRKARRRRSAWPGLHVLAPAMAALLIAAVIVPSMLIDSGSDESLDGAASGGSSSAGIESAEQSAPSSSSEDSAARAKPEPPASGAGGGAAPAPALAAPVPPTGGGSPTSDRRQARRVERSASMTLVARPGEIDTVADRIVQTADANRGFVVSSSVGTVEGGGGGQFLLRVPTSRLDTVLAQLSRLAHVRERNQQTEDITAQHTSARSRLQDARAERRSLLRRLAAAVTETEAEALKAQLRDVNARISAAKADLARVTNRATFANVAVSLAADPEASAAGEDNQWSPGDAAKDALRVLEVAAGVLLVALAVGLPLGLLVLAGFLAVRWSARRGRERTLDAV